LSVMMDSSLFYAEKTIPQKRGFENREL